MPDLSLSHGSERTPESVVVHPKRPPRGLRRAASWLSNLLPAGLLVALVIDGATNAFVVVGAALLACAWLLSAVVALRRRGDGASRYDRRDEVVIPAALAAQIRGLRQTDQRREAWELLQRETGLGLGDAMRALDAIDQAERSERSHHTTAKDTSGSITAGRAASSQAKR